MLFNESMLLERYQVLKFNYFIDIRSILQQHLKSMYCNQQRDLRNDFIFLHLDDKVVDYKTDLLNSTFFHVKISLLKDIANDFFYMNPFSIDIFVLQYCREHHNKQKFQKYREIFVELSNLVYLYFKKNNTSIQEIDAMLRFHNFSNIHSLPIITSALFRYILEEEQNK